MEKKSHPITAPAEKVKKVTYQEYLSTFNWKRTPYSENMLRKVAEDYLNWARSADDALVLDEFPQSRGFILKTWYEWLRKYDFLQEAHQEAKRTVGARREKLAFLNKANTNIFIASSPHYDYGSKDMNWRELLELRESMKVTPENQKSQVTVVEIPVFTQTPEEVAGKINKDMSKYRKFYYEPRKPKNSSDPESVDVIRSESDNEETVSE